jgi:hypothetical protein
MAGSTVSDAQAWTSDQADGTWCHASTFGQGESNMADTAIVDE